MIIAVVVSVLIHLGFIAFVDSVPWKWDETKPKRVKISVSLKRDILLTPLLSSPLS